MLNDTRHFESWKLRLRDGGGVKKRVKSIMFKVQKTCRVGDKVPTYRCYYTLWIFTRCEVGKKCLHHLNNVPGKPLVVSTDLQSSLTLRWLWTRLRHGSVQNISCPTSTQPTGLLVSTSSCEPWRYPAWNYSESSSNLTPPPLKIKNTLIWKLMTHFRLLIN